jgi:hypothetical protein
VSPHYPEKPADMYYSHKPIRNNYEPIDTHVKLTEKIVEETEKNKQTCANDIA